MVPVSQGEQVAGFRRYGSVGRVTLGGMVAVLVAASATLSGCVSNSEGSSAVAAPGSAVEDALQLWDKVELTLVNTSGQQFTATAVVDCDVPKSLVVDPGESATFPPSSCNGSAGDVGKGKIEMKGVDTLEFRADNPWAGFANVKFTTGSASHTFKMPRDVKPEERYCMGGWTVASTSYVEGNPRKLTIAIGQPGTMPSSGCLLVPGKSTAQPLEDV